MISWLTWNAALWTIGTMGLLTYLWYDGKKLLGDIVSLLVVIILCGIITFCTGIAAPALALCSFIVGPFARLCGKNTDGWIGGSMLKVSSLLSWMKPKEVVFPEATKDRGTITHVSMPDGVYKLEQDDDKNAICPDCGGFLLCGPEAGASMNVMCDKCKARFMYLQFNGTLGRMS